MLSYQNILNLKIIVMKKATFYFIAILSCFFLFALTSCRPKNNTADGETAIKTIYKEFSEAVAAKDMKKIMSFYAPGNDLIAFDAFVPLQYKSAADYKKAYDDFFVAFPGPSKSIITDMNIKVSGNLAYASCIDKWTITGTDNKPIDMIFRATNVFENRNGNWLIIHEHLSLPVDPVSGKADYLSK